MSEKIETSTRRTVLKKSSIGALGATGLITMIGSASADSNQYYAEYRTQKHSPLGFGQSKLQIRVEWDVENGTISWVDTDITGRANAVGYSFDGITSKETSGGEDDEYFQIYAEGDYSEPIDSYTHWLDISVRSDGSHSANCNWRKEFVGAGER